MLSCKDGNHALLRRTLTVYNNPAIQIDHVTDLDHVTDFDHVTDMDHVIDLALLFARLVQRKYKTNFFLPTVHHFLQIAVVACFRK